MQIHPVGKLRMHGAMHPLPHINHSVIVKMYLCLYHAMKLGDVPVGFGAVTDSGFSVREC